MSFTFSFYTRRSYFCLFWCRSPFFGGAGPRVLKKFKERIRESNLWEYLMTPITLFFFLNKGMRVLVDAREKLHIPWGDNSNQLNGDKLMAFDTRTPLTAQGIVETQVFLQYLPAIRALWADSGIQNAYDRRREFQLVRDLFFMLWFYFNAFINIWL